MANKKKSFDAVAASRRWRRATSQTLDKMAPGEQVAFLNRQLNKPMFPIEEGDPMIALANSAPANFEARGNKLRAEARAEVTDYCAKGKAWEGLRKNVALLGIRGKPRVLFAGSRNSTV